MFFYCQKTCPKCIHYKTSDDFINGVITSASEARELRLYLELHGDKGSCFSPANEDRNKLLKPPPSYASGWCGHEEPRQSRE